jgi:hypothetical protein
MPIQHIPDPPRAATVSITVEPPAPLVGSMVRLVATFASAGQPFDPPSVGWTSRSPTGRKRGGQAVRKGPGVYELLDAPAIPGVWAYRVQGESGQGIAEREVHVLPSAL